MANGFSAQVQAVVSELQRRAARERDALAIEIVRELQQMPPLGTPVRTGWARGNWIATLDLSVALVPARGNASAALARSQASVVELLAYGPQRPLAKAHVFNPVPYVNRLDGVAHTRGGIEGAHSSQSAPGWIGRGVARAVSTRKGIAANSRATI